MPGAVPLAHPGTIANFVGGADLGNTGTGFRLHVVDGDYDFWSPLMETTGDGDSTPIFENNGLVYGRGAIRGYMVSASALVIMNLTSTGANPVVDFTLTFHASRILTLRLIVERIRIRHRKTAEIVGVSLLWRGTDVDPSIA